MKTLLRDVPLQRKLTIITMLTSSVALLVACLAFAAYEQVYARQNIVDDLLGAARMIGDNSSAALTFNDPVSAEQTLRSLSADEHIVSAVVYDRDGKVFATYQPAGAKEIFAPPAVMPDSSRFLEKHVEIFHRIRVAGESAGTVYIRSDLGELEELLWRYIWIVMLVMIVASLVAFLLSSALRGVISKPIAGLADVLRRIATQKDYSVRAAKQGDDELGQLIDGFNEMLGQIQSRDSALQEARRGLELRVNERTAELQTEIAEHRRAEVALKSSEERFSNAFEYASIGMALATPDRAFIKVNRALCALLGYSQEEMLGKTVDDITHPEDVEPTRENIRKLVAREISHYQMEKRYLHKQGHSISAHVSISMVRDAQDKPLYFIGQIQDISERKRAEAELEQTHKQLVDASRRAGMTEIASNVLHNVGNVLNSVNVSINLVADNLRRSKAGNLARAAALLHEHEHDLGAFLSTDPKGRRLPDYLAQLSERLVADQDATGKEVELLRSNIDHIKEIVAMQQHYAKVSAVTETVNIRDLVEDSLRMNAGALVRHDVRVIREFEEVPPINLDKHKVLQILVNLIRNAKYACEESGRQDKLLILRVAKVDSNVCISVIDNGVGIPPDNLTRIFMHGFTTRPSGHGFGLHGGALAAREIGGKLSVHSDGTGKGATFTLELPLRPPGRDDGRLLMAAEAA
jgi:PAS domain S-box-containing protein